MDEHAKLREVRVELGDAHTAGALFEPICDLFAEVFSQPPANLGPEDFASQRAYFSSMRERETFGMAVGMADGELIGFAYGYTLTPDARWWDGLLEPLPNEITQEWQGRTFALIDFAVKEGWRGKGLGRQLHDVLLGSRTEERATVAAEPAAATDTQDIYAKWGWQKLGRLQGPSTDLLPFFDIYIRPLVSRVVSS